jgi:hypothetical protein
LEPAAGLGRSRDSVPNTHAMRNELVEELIVEQEAQGMQDLLPAVE